MDLLHIGAAILGAGLVILIVYGVIRSRRRLEETPAPTTREVREPLAAPEPAAERPASAEPEPAKPEPAEAKAPEPMPVGLPEAEAKEPIEKKAPAPPPPEAKEKAPLPQTPEERRRHIGAVRKGLGATRGGLVVRLSRLFKGRKEISADLARSIEEVLITSDVGAKTAARLIERLQERLSSKELADEDRVWNVLRDEARAVLDIPFRAPNPPRGEPYVILVIGVNGGGKTTTIGKLAARYKDEGRKVLLAAADTFRAAAVSQLRIWGHRVGCDVVSGKEGADPSSVAFDAIERAKTEGVDVVLVDTAGRLHTKQPLMEELRKIARASGKAQAGAPHEVLLTLDATTGQNAIQQAATFLEATNVTGIVLTKLDGTAKGGVILGIADALGIPVRYIGVGEGIDDLRPFDPEVFVAALFEDLDEVTAAA